MKITTLRDFAS